MRLPIILLRTRQKYSSSWFCFHALPNLKMYGTKTVYPLQRQNKGINTFRSLYWQKIQVFFIHKERQDSGFSQITWELCARKAEMSLSICGRRVVKGYQNSLSRLMAWQAACPEHLRMLLKKTLGGQLQHLPLKCSSDPVAPLRKFTGIPKAISYYPFLLLPMV